MLRSQHHKKVYIIHVTNTHGVVELDGEGGRREGRRKRGKGGRDTLSRHVRDQVTSSMLSLYYDIMLCEPTMHRLRRGVYASMYRTTINRIVPS
jgi:hypothetical protein